MFACENVLSVPQNSTVSGRILKALPPWNLPIVRAVVSKGEKFLEIIVWYASTTLVKA